MFRVLTFLLQRLRQYYIVLILSIISLANMHFRGIRGILLGSIGGEYVSILIIIGMFFRIYVNGKIKSVRDYDFSHSFINAIFILCGNILIILGFTFLAKNKVQYIISLALIVLNVFKLLTGDIQEEPDARKSQFSLTAGLYHELPVIIFITIIGICSDYITFANGAMLLGNI